MFTRNKEQAMRILAEILARTNEPGEILDSLFAELEIEVEWEDEPYDE
jgi:hypothetical protein